MQAKSPLCALVSDFTIGGLAPILAKSSPGPSIESVVAPYDQVLPTLLDARAECWVSEPQMVIVWTRPQSVIRSFGKAVDGIRVDLEHLLREVDEYAECLRTAVARVEIMIVPTWTWPSFDRGEGARSLDATHGLAYFLMRMNARLIEKLDGTPGVFVMDAGRWLSVVGPTAQNPKLWYLGKIAFSPEVFAHAAADIKALVRAVRGESRKLLIVDLDDTLWGGILGDVGWQNLELGGHSPLGEAFRHFQQGLKALSRRGIVLGIVSKNTEEVALEAIDSHPEMLLRRADFAGWRINWRDKAENIVDLVSDLNLGLQSVVFVDDSPVERSRVREALPQVFVPEWPADKLLYSKSLAELDCFDTTFVGEEDTARTKMYVAERARESLKQAGQSIDDYLQSLGMQISCSPVTAANLKRTVQLLNKTNQMNLRTRRLTEAQLREWLDSPCNQMLTFRVADRFGDYGLTGLASMTIDGSTAEVADFVLSCRVMGRGIEQLMVSILVQQAIDAGAECLRFTYLRTDRNAPCRAFLDEQSLLEKRGDCFWWPVSHRYSAPDHFTVEYSISESTPSRIDPTSQPMSA